MEDNKTMFYIVAIVAVVAVVGLIVMVAGNSGTKYASTTSDEAGQAVRATVSQIEYLDPTDCEMIAFEEIGEPNVRIASCRQDQIIQIVHVSCMDGYVPQVSQFNYLGDVSLGTSNLPWSIGYTCHSADSSSSLPNPIYASCCNIKGFVMGGLQSKEVKVVTKTSAVKN